MMLLGATACSTHAPLQCLQKGPSQRLHTPACTQSYHESRCLHSPFSPPGIACTLIVQHDALSTAACTLAQPRPGSHAADGSPQGSKDLSWAYNNDVPPPRSSRSSRRGSPSPPPRRGEVRPPGSRDHYGGEEIRGNRRPYTEDRGMGGPRMGGYGGRGGPPSRPYPYPGGGRGRGPPPPRWAALHSHMFLCLPDDRPGPHWTPMSKCMACSFNSDTAHFT